MPASRPKDTALVCHRGRSSWFVTLKAMVEILYFTLKAMVEILYFTLKAMTGERSRIIRG